MGHDWLISDFGMITAPDPTLLNSSIVRDSDHIKNFTTARKLAIFCGVELNF